MKKKVAIIGTNGLPAKYGGFETLANYLVRDLNKEYSLTVYCSAIHKGNQIKKYNGANLIHIPLSANGIQGILYDILSIVHALIFAEVLLILGSSGTIILPLNIIFRKKIVFNFGGLDWQREKWNYAAQKFLKWLESIGIKFSNSVIVDNAVFLKYVKEYYNIESYLIEYGGDHVIIDSELNTLSDYNLKSKEYFLSVSRAQEDNNIHILLEAFLQIPNRTLAVISNWNISEYGRQIKKKYSGINNIFLIDAIYEQEKIDCIRNNAYCYIHTHSACGSAPSLIEAMNFGLPIISFDVPANRATTEEKAIFFKDSNELVSTINQLKTEQLECLGIHSLEIAQRRYKWSTISNKYKELL